MEESSLTTLPPASHTKGFIGTMLDFSFQSFITTKFVGFLYGLSLIAAGAFTIRWMLEGSIFDTIWRFIAAPFVFAVFAILARIALEIILVVFRILESLRRIEASWNNSTSKFLSDSSRSIRP